MTLQALAAGSLHFGSGGPEAYIEASERGLDFVVTGGIINGMRNFSSPEGTTSLMKICVVRRLARRT
jgi:hypothetical protein